MSIEDDEPKTKPEEKEKKDKDFGIGDIGMAGNDMMMIIVLLGAFVLFKDEIMGMFNGAGAAPTTPAPEAEATPTEGAEPAEGAKAGGKKKGGRHGGKRRRGGKRGGGGAAEEPAEAGYGMSYFGIANA